MGYGIERILVESRGHTFFGVVEVVKVIAEPMRIRIKKEGGATSEIALKIPVCGEEPGQSLLKKCQRHSRAPSSQPSRPPNLINRSLTHGMSSWVMR